MGKDGQEGRHEPIRRTQAGDKGTDITVKEKLIPPTHDGKLRGGITEMWQM